MSADESTPRRYPWSRILTALSLLVLATCGLTLVFGESLFRASSAVAKLQKLGAKVDFNDAKLYGDFRLLWRSLSSRKLAVTVTSVYCTGGSPCQIRDEDLFYVRAFPELHSVDLRDQAITSTGLRHLAGLNLASLCLARTQVGGASPGLAPLATLRKLRNLDLSGTQITDEELKSLSALYQLLGLNLSNTRITAAGTSHLSGLLGLTLLNLDHTSVTDTIASSLTGMNRLTHLGLNDTPVTGVGFDKLAHRKLKHLQLSRSAVTDAGLRDISQISTLAGLGLSETRVSPAGLKHLAGLTELRSLSLEGPEFRDEHLAAIAGCVKLTSLKISSVHITAAGINHLRALQHLAHIEMTAAQLQDPEIIGALIALPTLSSIDLRRDSRSDLDVEEVQHQLSPKVRLFEVFDDSSTPPRATEIPGRPNREATRNSDATVPRL